MKKLYNQIWYRPMEIAKLGLIKNSHGDTGTLYSNYNFILELIRSGRLRAKNYSTGTKRQAWLVPESEIERYHNTVTEMS